MDRIDPMRETRARAWRLLKSAAVLGLVLGAAPLRAQCPDEVAAPRPEVEHQVLGGELCGWVALLFDELVPGLPIRCPQAVIHVPEHRTCEPSPGSGRECFAAGEVPVTRTPYECVVEYLQVGIYTVLEPRCQPGTSEVIGYLPDAADRVCEP